MDEINSRREWRETLLDRLSDIAVSLDQIACALEQLAENQSSPVHTPIHTSRGPITFPAWINRREGR
jgi:hypothetical protein